MDENSDWSIRELIADFISDPHICSYDSGTVSHHSNGAFLVGANPCHRFYYCCYYGFAVNFLLFFWLSSFWARASKELPLLVSTLESKFYKESAVGHREDHRRFSFGLLSILCCHIEYLIPAVAVYIPRQMACLLHLLLRRSMSHQTGRAIRLYNVFGVVSYINPSLFGIAR